MQINQKKMQKLHDDLKEVEVKLKVIYSRFNLKMHVALREAGIQDRRIKAFQKKLMAFGKKIGASL